MRNKHLKEVGEIKSKHDKEIKDLKKHPPRTEIMRDVDPRADWYSSWIFGPRNSSSESQAIEVESDQDNQGSGTTSATQGGSSSSTSGAIDARPKF